MEERDDIVFNMIKQKPTNKIRWWHAVSAEVKCKVL